MEDPNENIDAQNAQIAEQAKVHHSAIEKNWAERDGRIKHFLKPREWRHNGSGEVVEAIQFDASIDSVDAIQHWTGRDDIVMFKTQRGGVPVWKLRFDMPDGVEFVDVGAYIMKNKDGFWALMKGEMEGEYALVSARVV